MEVIMEVSVCVCETTSGGGHTTREHLQCTTIGPVSGGVIDLTRLMNSSSGVGWSGTPWSGHAVNWNWRTSRFSADTPFYTQQSNDSSALTSFRRSTQTVDFTKFLRCYSET